MSRIASITCCLLLLPSVTAAQIQPIKKVKAPHRIRAFHPKSHRDIVGVLGNKRSVYNEDFELTHWTGRLKRPIYLYRFSETGRIPKKIRGKKSFGAVTEAEFTDHMDYGKSLGYALLYAKNRESALGCEGEAFEVNTHYRYLMKVMVKAGAEVAVIGGSEKEVVVRDPKKVKLLSRPRPIEHDSISWEFVK